MPAIPDLPYKTELQPQQYAELYQEEELPLPDVRRSALRRLAYGGALGALLLALLAATLPIPLEQPYAFVLRSTKPEEIYRYPQVSYLLRRHVQAGQRVVAGAPLVEISSPHIVELIAELRRAEQEQRLGRQQDSLLYQQTAQSWQLTRRNLHLAARQEQREQYFTRQLQARDLARLGHHAAEARRRLQLERQLLDGRYVAEVEVKDYEKEQVRAASELAMARQRYARELSEQGTALGRLAVEQQLARQQLEQLRLAQAQHARARAAAVARAADKLRLHYGRSEVRGQALLLRAPMAGEVSFVFDATKEVPAGAILLRLRDRQAPLYALCTAGPERIGYLRRGQSVALKVSTFPHFDWGTARGRVQAVSLTPDAQGNYPFTVALTDAGRLGARLQVGMTGRLSVLATEKTLLSLLGGRLQQAADAYTE